MDSGEFWTIQHEFQANLGYIMRLYLKIKSREMAQLVQCLPYKQWGLGLVPSTHIPKLGMVVRGCKSSS